MRFMVLQQLWLASSVGAFSHHHHQQHAPRFRSPLARLDVPLRMTVQIQSPVPKDGKSSQGGTETFYQVEQSEMLSSTQSSRRGVAQRGLAVLALASTAVALWDAHLLQVLWHAYQQALGTHPIYTKSVTSATVYAVGDAVAQRTAAATNQKETPLDAARIVRSMLAGGLGHGPLSHFYYNLSEDFFGHVLHWTAWWSVIPKIVVDQTMFGPFWNNAYILLLGLMQGHSLSKIGQEMRTSTLPLVISGLKLWPAVHVVTYGLVPVPYRLVWVDAVEVVWVSILATQAAASASGEESNMITTDSPSEPIIAVEGR